MGSNEYTEMKRSGASVLFVVLGFVMALASLIAHPYSLITGIVGVALGILATKSHNRTGIAVIITNIILLGIGMIYSGAILAYLRHITGI